MKIIKLVNEQDMQNNYIVATDTTAILIDGNAMVSQIEENLKMLDNKLKLSAIFLTHEHFDHIRQVDNLIAKYKCPVYISKLGKNNLYSPDKNVSVLDTPFKVTNKRQIKTFKDNEELIVGDLTVKCYLTPGHSMGSACFVIDDNMFTGDTVFKVSVGRSDLFGGDEAVQKISLIRIKNELSENVENFYSGHGANFNKSEMEYNVDNFLGE